MIAQILEHRPGTSLDAIGDLDLFQIKYLYLRPEKEKATPHGPKDPTAAYESFYVKQGLDPAAAKAKAKELLTKAKAKTKK